MYVIITSLFNHIFKEKPENHSVGSVKIGENLIICIFV